MTGQITLPQGAVLKRAPEQQQNQPAFRLPPGATIKRAPGMEAAPVEAMPQAAAVATEPPQLEPQRTGRIWPAMPWETAPDRQQSPAMEGDLLAPDSAGIVPPQPTAPRLPVTHYIDPRNPLEAPLPPDAPVNLPAPDPGYRPSPDQPPVNYELLPPGVDPSLGRLETAGAQFVRGVADVGAGMAKAVGLVESGRAENILGMFDEIDRGDEPISRGYLVGSKVARPGFWRDIAEYYDASPARRAELRQQYQALTDPRSQPAFQAGEELSSGVAAAAPVNPEYAGEFVAGTVPQALGSATGFALTGLAGRTVGMGAFVPAAVAGSALEASGQFEDAIAHGATLEEAFDAAKLGGIIGTSEAIPITDLLGRLDKYTGGGVKRALIDAMKQGTEEGLQEAFQNIASNLVASELVGYDQKRGLFTGTGENAAAGFTVGALMQTVVAVAMPGRYRGSPPPSDQPINPYGRAVRATAASGEQIEGSLVGIDKNGYHVRTADGRKELVPHDGDIQFVTQPEQQPAEPTTQEGVPEGAMPGEVVIGREAAQEQSPGQPRDVPAQQPEESAASQSPRGQIEDILNDERTADQMRTADERAAREAEAAAQQAETEALARVREQYGLPETGQPVTVLAPDGEAVTGTLEDVFTIDGTAQARIVTDRGDAVEVFLDDVSVSQGSGRQADPVTVEKPEDVDVAASRANPAPSPAQKEAGNYAKGHMKWQGLDITIENARGSERSGVGQDGAPWSVTMPSAYGYVKRSEGADGDHVDVYVGENPDSDQVVVIDQIDPATGKFDEHKVMLGFSEEKTSFPGGYAPQWLATYLQAFSDGSGPERVGAYSRMTVAGFKEWLANGNTRKPLAYKPAPAESSAPGTRGPVERRKPPAASEPPSPAQPGASVSPESQPTAEPEGTPEPWQLTSSEYAQQQERAYIEKRGGRVKASAADNVGTAAMKRHRRLVEQAIADGKDVPAEVRAEYGEPHGPSEGVQAPEAATAAKRAVKASEATYTTPETERAAVPAFADFTRDRWGPKWQLVRNRRQRLTGGAETRVLHSEYRKAQADHRKLILDALEAGHAVPARVLTQHEGDDGFMARVTELTGKTHDDLMSVFQEDAALAPKGRKPGKATGTPPGTLPNRVPRTDKQLQQMLDDADATRHLQPTKEAKRRAGEQQAQTLADLTEAETMAMAQEAKLLDISPEQQDAQRQAVRAAEQKAYDKLRGRRVHDEPSARQYVDGFMRGWSNGDALPSGTRSALRREGFDAGVEYAREDPPPTPFASEYDISVEHGEGQRATIFVRADSEVIARIKKQFEGARGQRKFYSLAEEGEPPRTRWRKAFPRVATHTTVRIRDTHPDYAAAKSGDEAAAVRLANDLVRGEEVQRIRNLLRGRKAVVVPVRAMEAGGRNLIPDAYAKKLADDLGLSVDSGIVQANVVTHTRASGFHRMAMPAAFDGQVKNGADYLIVDDHVGMGGTIANLKGYIESHGGRVILATTLTASRDSQHIALRPETLAALREKHGTELESYWREKFGYGFDALTEPEAGYLLRTPDAERIRDRIAEAEREGLSGIRGRSEGEGRLSVAEARHADAGRTGSAAGKLATESRLRAKGIRPPATEEGKLSRAEIANTEPADKAGFSVAERRNQIKAALRAELDAMGLGDVALEVHERITAMVDGRRRTASGHYITGLIELSMQASDMRVTLNHEALHALRDLNLFTGAEWAALAAKSDAWRKEYRIDQRYKGEPEWLLVEEAIADAYGRWAAGDMKAGGLVLRAFNKIRRILERIGNALRGLGYRTAEDIFEAIKSGEVGDRPRTATGLAKEAASRYSLIDPEHGTVSDEAKRQRAMQGFIARGHPVDRALRIPFHIFGGIDGKGEWKPGKFLSEKAADIVVNAKFDSDGRFAWINGALHAARSGLLDRYGLSEEYTARDRKRQLDERGIMLQGVEIIKTLKEQGVGAEEARVLQAVLTGEEIAEGDWQGLAEPIRKAIDDMGQEAVHLGLVSADSYARNRGTYLHRVYHKHEADEPALARWAGQFFGRRRRQLIGNELKGRGMFMNVKADRLSRDMPDGKTPQSIAILDKPAPEGSKREVSHRVYWPSDAAVPEKYADYVEKGTWRVRGERNGKVTLWRDYTPAERERMGEILDARYTIAKTFMLMAHDLAVGRFYQDIAGNPEWASANEPEGDWVDAAEYRRFWGDEKLQWVKVPDTTVRNTGGKKRWGALAGRWVRAEIWRDLNEIDAMQRRTLWKSLLTQWKLNKTARSPVVHMNNVMSNVMFMDMADVRAQDLAKGLRAYIKGNRFYRDAVRHGAFGADMMSQEIRQTILEPILREIEAEAVAGKSPLEARFGMVGKLAHGLWDKAHAIDRKMIDLYRLEDEVFRMATYMRRLSLGDTPAQAADFARRQFLDYDIRAPWVNAARATVLPFIAYTYRAVPVIAQSLAVRPWKLAKYFTAAYAANILAYMIAPGDEDEERRSMRDEERGYTWVGVPRMLRMPYRDDYGNPVFLDIRRWIPAGDVFDMNQGSSAIPVPAPIQFGGPIMLGAELMLNRSAFTGDDIVNTATDDWWRTGEKVGDWAWKSWMPSAAWVPGSWYWEKIGRAASGARDSRGRPYRIPEAVASSVGIKLKPQDVELNFEFRRREFRRVEQDLKAEARRLGRDLARGMISTAEYNRQMRRIMDGMERNAQRARETFNKKNP